MKILVVTQYFWPEFFIINDLVKTLASQGHTIKVLTGKPNYPDGEIFDGYTQESTHEEVFDNNVSVYRVPLRPRKKGGGRNLFLNYGSFIWNGLRFFPAEVKGEQYDVIFVFAPSPITTAIPALYLKWRLKTHLAIWIQDLWPESLSATGFIKNRFLLMLVRLLVRGIYSRADTLLVQSKGFIEPVSRYSDVKKIIYYPNSYKDEYSAVNPGLTLLKGNALPVKLTNLLKQFFCITFAGNLGTAQALETIVGAAAKLKNVSNLRIVLVGSGALFDWLIEQKEKKKLDNLVLAGRFPSEMMPQIFQLSEALLVTLKKEEIFSYTVPGKVQAYLASSRPIIAALDGEGARVIENAGVGLTCGSEDVNGLVACIESLYGMSDMEKQKMSESGRAYYLKNFEMGLQAKHLVKILDNRLVTNG